MWLLHTKRYAKYFTSILSINPTLLDRGDDDSDVMVMIRMMIIMMEMMTIIISIS